ncbi:hypothetical protein ACU8V7_02270 [Zobellia nedashkovskayae]
MIWILENNEENLSAEIKQWLAFAKQKLDEVATLKQLANKENLSDSLQKLIKNSEAQANKKTATLIHNQKVKQRVAVLTAKDDQRESSFPTRQKLQKNALNLPLFPTTTIGSFPQTKEVRSWRANFKKGNLSVDEYNVLLEKRNQRYYRIPRTHRS